MGNFEIKRASQNLGNMSSAGGKVNVTSIYKPSDYSHPFLDVAEKLDRQFAKTVDSIDRAIRRRKVENDETTFAGMQNDYTKWATEELNRIKSLSDQERAEYEPNKFVEDARKKQAEIIKSYNPNREVSRAFTNFGEKSSTHSFQNVTNWKFDAEKQVGITNRKNRIATMSEQYLATRDAEDLENFHHAVSDAIMFENGNQTLATEEANRAVRKLLDHVDIENIKTADSEQLDAIEQLFNREGDDAKAFFEEDIKAKVEGREPFFNSFDRHRYLEYASGRFDTNDERRKIYKQAIKQRREQIKNENKRIEREQHEVIARTFTDKELAIRDVAPEQWADEYEKLGRDEVIRASDPARAIRYLDAARDIREAQKKAEEHNKAQLTKAQEDAYKEMIKTNEEGLSVALTQIEIEKLNGTLSQDEYNTLTANIWKKYRVLSSGRGISPSFSKSFLSRLQGNLTDQEANAMRKFYNAFGYNPDMNNAGEITATGRKQADKDDVSYYSPFERNGKQARVRKFQISASDLVTYGDALLRTIRSADPSINREGMVEKEINNLKKHWTKKNIDKNIQDTVNRLIDIEREMKINQVVLPKE